MLRHGTQLGGSRGLGKRAWPERRRPAVLPAARNCCSVSQVLAVHAVQCPGALAVCAFPSPLVAWTTASDRLKKDPGRAPQHDRGRHWPGVEATRGPAPGNNKAALYSLLSCKHTVWPMTTCTSVSLPPAHTAGKTHIYVAARLHPEARRPFSPNLKHQFGTSSPAPPAPPTPHLHPSPSLSLRLDQPPAFCIACACSSPSAHLPLPLTLTSPASPRLGDVDIAQHTTLPRH